MARRFRRLLIRRPNKMLYGEEIAHFVIGWRFPHVIIIRHRRTRVAEFPACTRIINTIGLDKPDATAFRDFGADLRHASHGTSKLCIAAATITHDSPSLENRKLILFLMPH